MNQQAYWELANIYQRKNNVNNAVKTLLNYYDLILPTSSTGIQTIQKLKNLSGLKWIKNIYWDNFDNIEMGVDNEMIFLYLDNNIEAYRLNSGIMIWRTEIGDDNNHTASAGAMDEVVLLQNFVNGDLVAINFDGGLLNWSLERWTQQIGIAEKIWYKKNAYNRVFCLTEDDSLFTLNMTDGKIINRIPTDRHDYKAYYDNAQNGMVLNNDEYLISIFWVNANKIFIIV
jgi:hypothetical protein